MNICSVKDCERPVRCRSLCSMHYSRALASGDIGTSEPKRTPAKGKICSQSDCNLPVRCIGLCSKHYDLAIRSDICLCGNRKNKNSHECKPCWAARNSENAQSSKTCPGCSSTKPVEEFGYRIKDGIRRVRSRCRTCTSKEAADRRKRNPQKAKEAKLRAAKKYREKPYEEKLIGALRSSARTLNLNPDEIIRHYLDHSGRCDICDRLPEEAGKYKRLSIDHDHKTGEFRGLLCSQCNIGIGLFEDSKDRLLSALRYLT